MRRCGFLILAAIGACSASSSPIITRGHAVDADTVSIPVRLQGVDAFEYRQRCQTTQGQRWACGQDAQNFTANFIPDATFERSVGTVSAGAQDLGMALILEGFAIPLPGFLKNDPERASAYSRAYEQAKKSRRGAFAGTWIEPQRWRRGERLACERAHQ